MKKPLKYIYSTLIIFLFILTSLNINAAHLHTILTLSGQWKFSLGDDKSWSTPNFDDDKWDDILVPTAWEKQGYVGYDGFAWYRKHFIFPSGSNEETYFLQVSNIDDVDEIYINGHFIGQTGKFPPESNTGYSVERKYVIPPSYLNVGKDNCISVRVYDDGGEGGIVSGPVRLAYDDDEQYLLINFNENWKFKLHDNLEYKNIDYKNDDWKDIKVPQIWESQGYWNYDGFAWYRNNFEIESDFKLKDIYLVLGKIDDYDEVYVNGKKIGDHWPMTFGRYFFRSSTPYNELRGYKIPNGLLKKGKNVIAVRVFDSGGLGGIYEGPVGIMSEDSYDELKDKYSFEKHFNFFGNFEND
jgi:sialate O-acetylesterase